jgi:hypothetical protein
MIIDYYIVKCISSYNLQGIVLTYIKNGYIPQGGVCVSTTQGCESFYQAMIKIQST